MKDYLYLTGLQIRYPFLLPEEGTRVCLWNVVHISHPDNGWTSNWYWHIQYL